MYILKWMACAVEDFVWMKPSFMESSTQVKILKGLNPDVISKSFLITVKRVTDSEKGVK